ncbi:hypothetical protein [Oceanospirillum maris]|jgi:predicted  nucleic acid-binding Zn-ribbon protein|uniref:hypothetical protein n=1 Tax=Oceanospirillum maris TaxID=64977 RepID=UPI000403EFE9|nr:hypothetical protein [Oceanospirillum maris]
MSFLIWRSIVDQVSALESVALKEGWEQIPELGAKLDQDLRSFFETQISDLTAEEQGIVKQEGNQVVTTIYTLLEKAKQEKKKINNEAGKMARGKKGISAYKKT